MFKKTLVAGFIVSALAGCQTLSGEDAAKVDRKEWSDELQTRCAQLEQNYTPAGEAVDITSRAVLAATTRQCGVLDDYRALAENYADIIGFMEVNSDLNDIELKAAIDAFDADKPADKKIAPLIEKYEAASDSIFQENVKLAVQMVALGVDIALIAKNNAVDIGTEIALTNATGWLGNLVSSDDTEEDQEESAAESVPIVRAYFEMQDRTTLALDAQDLISEEKALVERISSIDEIIEEKVKS